MISGPIGSGTRNTFGIPFLSKGPPGLVRVLNSIIDGMDRMRIGSSADIVAEQTGGRTLLRFRVPLEAMVRRVSPEISHPFKVRLTDTTDPAAPKATIDASSYLWTGYQNAGATQTITDLTTPITLAANMRVYLRLTVSSLTITATAIVTSTSALGNVVTSGSPASQTQANWLIGRVQSGALPAGKAGFGFSISGTAYHFEQTLFSHLIATSVCVNGQPSYVLQPHSGS
jgi:hypothetical protein